MVHVAVVRKSDSLYMINECPGCSFNFETSWGGANLNEVLCQGGAHFNIKKNRYNIYKLTFSSTAEFLTQKHENSGFHK